MLYLHKEPLADEHVAMLDSNFDYNCKVEWFLHPLVKRIIEMIDGNKVCGPTLYDSPILGAIGPQSLAGGTKLLIWMLNEPQYHFPMHYMGDNCAPALELVSNEVDCHLQYDKYLLHFTDTQKVISPYGTLCTGLREVIEVASKEGWY